MDLARDWVVHGAVEVGLLGEGHEGVAVLLLALEGAVVNLVHIAVVLLLRFEGFALVQAGPKMNRPRLLYIRFGGAGREVVEVDESPAARIITAFHEFVRTD